MSPKTWLWIVLAVTGGFRLYAAQTLPLLADEAYYWQWSRHLAAGYYDGGPLVAYTIRLGTLAAGETLLGIRLPAVLMGLASLYLLFDLGRVAGLDRRLGLGLVIGAGSSPLFAVGGLIHTYDIPQLFFWLLALDLSARAVLGSSRPAWYGAGAALGLALLAKYSSLLLALGVLIHLLASPRARPWLRQKEPYLAVLIALLVFSPNLLWNAAHGWTAFDHVLGLGTGGGGRSGFWLADFLGTQLLLLGPGLALLLAWGLVRGLRLRGPEREPLAFLLWTSLPTLGLFAVMSCWTKVLGNWPWPGYPGALAAAAIGLAGLGAGSAGLRRAALFGLGSGYLLLLLLLVYQPLASAVNLKPEQDPAARYLGWPGLGPVISRGLSQWPAHEPPFLLGYRYQIASLAAFYTPGQPETHCLIPPGNRPNQYLYWGPPPGWAGRDALCVARLGLEGRPSRVVEGGQVSLIPYPLRIQRELALFFHRVEKIGEFDLHSPPGRVVNRVALFRCLGYRGGRILAGLKGDRGKGARSGAPSPEGRSNRSLAGREQARPLGGLMAKTIKER